MENPVHGESRQAGLIVLCTVTLTMAVVAVALRCWSIYVLPLRKFGLDDFFAIATLPFMIAEFALIYWWISLGLGLHAATLPAESLLQTPKIMFAASLLSGVAIALPKFSALFFYYRIFGDTTRWVYRALWLLGGLNVAWLAAALLSTVFSCTPVQASWTKVEGSHCIQQQPWYLGVAIPSTIIDACIMALPMPMLWGLKASKSRRAFVSFIFICGYCVIIVSIGRLVALVEIGKGLFNDPTWDSVSYVEWIQCEAPISVMSVSLPNLLNMARHVHRHGVQGAFRRNQHFHNQHFGQMKQPSHAISKANGLFQRTDEAAGEVPVEKILNKRSSHPSNDISQDLLMYEMELNVLKSTSGAGTRRNFAEDSISAV